MNTTNDDTRHGGSGWAPGKRVITDSDHAAWIAWRIASKRDAQRARRARHHRIDYYPDHHAASVIYGMAGRRIGGDLSSVINRIVAEWTEMLETLPPELSIVKWPRRAGPLAVVPQDGPPVLGFARIRTVAIGKYPALLKTVKGVPKCTRFFSAVCCWRWRQALRLRSSRR